MTAVVVRPLAEARASLRERLVWPYVVLCAAAAVAASALGGSVAVFDAPLVFAALVAALVVLDATATKIFGSGHIAPTTEPSIALALLFGPFGVVAGEAVLTIKRAALHKPRSATSSTSARSDWPEPPAGRSRSRCPTRASACCSPASPPASPTTQLTASCCSSYGGLDEDRGPIALWQERLAGGKGIDRPQLVYPLGWAT